MAPRIAGELAGGMAHDGHIHRRNYEFTSIKGPAPVTARGYDPNLCHIDSGHVARNGHTLGTASDGSILEFTYPEGPVPSLTEETLSYIASQSSCPHIFFVVRYHRLHIHRRPLCMDDHSVTLAHHLSSLGFHQAI